VVRRAVGETAGAPVSFERTLSESCVPEVVARWPDARVWEAMESHRWYPPSSRRVTTENYELAVTPGSANLTWIYGFHARDARHAERLLGEIREKVHALGGTGARIQVTPQTRPPALSDQLSGFQFEPMESAEVLVCDLRDEHGGERLPSFRPTPGLTVREITSRADHSAVESLTSAIFDLPTPSEEVRAGFVEMYERQIRESGHSGRFLALDGTRPVGSAGLTIEGAVALLWGSGVLPEFRGRGIYGALVEARCRSASGRGAEIALVAARTGTSGPILKRHGFRVVGPIGTYEAHWAGAGPSP
jgi:GNAT superfamily N-acetyltransferase